MDQSPNEEAQYELGDWKYGVCDAAAHRIARRSKPNIVKYKLEENLLADVPTGPFPLDLGCFTFPPLLPFAYKRLDELSKAEQLKMARKPCSGKFNANKWKGFREAFEL